MRLLLLLSAILSALTGVAQARSAVVPAVAASALAGGQTTRLETVAVKVAGWFAPAPRVRTAVVQGIQLKALTLRRAYPLYADRPRE